jgi:SAM-dependent methyltransferase
MRLVDIGCSSGWLSSIVLGKGFNEYVGVDRVIVGRAQPRPGVAFLEGSVFNLPFSDGSFDAACMFDVIEHLPRGSEVAALREIGRVMSTQGKLYFSTPHASPLHTPLDPVWPIGHRHYRRSTVQKMMRSAGFTLDQMFVAGGAVEGLNHLRLLTYKHIFHRRLPSIAVVNQLIERSYGNDRRLGMTIFATGRKEG